LITKTLARPAPRKGFWVAVLPFKYTGGSAHLTALAEGLTEEIATGLSRFSYLRVIARVVLGCPLLQRVSQRQLQWRANLRCQVQHAGLLLYASHPVDTYNSDLPVPVAPEAKK